MHQFLNCIFEWNSTCFVQFLCPSSGVIHCTLSNGICHTGLQTAFEQQQDHDGTALLSWSCLKSVYKPVWHIPLLCVQWITPDDGQRNCPKHVEFHSKIKLRNCASIWFYYKESTICKCKVTCRSWMTKLRNEQACFLQRLQTPVAVLSVTNYQLCSS
jgi:hypothetical protein